MDATARRTSTNHKNLLTGATSALSADSLKKAIKVFLDQTDADGKCARAVGVVSGEREARTAKQPQGPAPISVEPSILLVPTALKFLAVELTRGAALMMSGISPEP